jgi:CRP-like cAMP-binding protein
MLKVPPATTADLSRSPLFADLGEEQLQGLLDQHHLVTLEPDQIVVFDQEEAEGVMQLRSGIAKARSFSPDGEEVVLSLLGPGDVFGELSMLCGGRRTADVVTLTACEVLKLRASSIRSLLRSEPLLGIALATVISRRQLQLNRRLILRGADATTRLLAAILDLALHTDVGAEPTAVIPPLCVRELATLAGVARETASRTLSKLRHRGTIADVEGGGLRIVDLEPLRRRALL